jgi:SAM-dependent methyltransferase
MAQVLKPYLGNRILEIGAGMGNMTLQFLPRDHYIASDYDPLHIDYLQALAARRPKLQVCRIDAQDPVDFKPFHESVDTVICLNVLEHLPKAPTALRNMYDALQPGGRALLLVPQGPWLYSPLDKAVDHVKRYTTTDFRAEIEAQGFEVEKTFHFNKMGVLGWAFNGKVLGRSEMARFQLKLYDSMTWLWRRIDRFLPWHGLSLIAVARKPIKSTLTLPTHEALRRVA